MFTSLAFQYAKKILYYIFPQAAIIFPPQKGFRRADAPYKDPPPAPRRKGRACRKTLSFPIVGLNEFAEKPHFLRGGRIAAKFFAKQLPEKRKNGGTFKISARRVQTFLQETCLSYKNGRYLHLKQKNLKFTFDHLASFLLQNG